MHKPLKKITTPSFIATLGAALLLSVASPDGAAAQGSAETSAAGGVRAEALLIAATGRDEIVAALQAQGFTVTEIGSTLLGRIRIEAASELGVREVIVHRGTGEILRDVLWAGSARAGAAASVEGRSTASNATAGTGARTSASTGGSSTAGGGSTTSGGASASVDIGGGASVGGGSVSVGGSSSTIGGISLGN